MSRYLRLYNTKSQYDSDIKDTPNVSYVIDIDKVFYTPELNVGVMLFDNGSPILMDSGEEIQLNNNV